jgi:hypothetical protein
MEHHPIDSEGSSKSANSHMALSTGYHQTTRKKDVAKALQYKKVQERYGTRTKFWNSK